MIERYLTSSAQQLFGKIQPELSLNQKRSLDRLLHIALYESLARSLPKNHRQHALLLLKSQDAAFDAWLQDVSPHSRIAIEESLLRTLLALRVE